MKVEMNEKIAMMEATQILLIPATLIGSVVLLVSCLFFKIRFRKKKRNEAKNKSETMKSEENNQNKGITNTGFGNSEEEIYENNEKVYDYATNEHKMRKGLNGAVKPSDISPAYSDADETRFYFTLERRPAENADEGTYVIAIPENVYDTPENDTTMEPNNSDIKYASQFYHTLEECYGADDDELSCQNAVPNEREKQVSIEIDEREISDDDTYVINIPKDEKETKHKLGAKIKKETIVIKDTEGTYVINIPSEDASKISPKMKGDKSLEQLGMEELEEVEKANCDRQKKRNSSLRKDEFESKEDGSREIYENVNACLYYNNEGEVSQNIIDEECSTSVKNESNSENTANSQENMENNEILAENKTKDDARQTSVDNHSTIQVQTSTGLSKNTKDDNQCYCDDDIYEDWEDNIISRANTVSGESGDGLNASADKQNESEDEIYQNEIFDVIEDQDSGESFYQNLKDFRSSLVMQDVR